MLKVGEMPEFEFHWAHMSAESSRLGILSGNRQVPVIRKLRKEMQTQNHRLFKLTTEPLSEGREEDNLSILEFEKVPAEGGEQSEYFQQRMEWVQRYFNMISEINGKKRNEFIPLVRYRPHQEGPLMGYIRSIDELNNSDDKELLNYHLDKLRKVQWFYSPEEGYTFHITGESQEERLESFYIGAWSYWLLTAALEGDNPLNLLIEFDDMLESYPIMGKKREALEYAAASLGKLTFVLQMSLIIQSPTVFPLQESLAEHLLIMDTESKDMDWKEIEGFPLILALDEAVWINNQSFGKLKLAVEFEKSV